MTYYHACVIIHKSDKGVAYEIGKVFGKFDIKIVGFEETPKPHFHILFKSLKRINYRFIRVNGVYIRFIRVKSRRHYFNLVNYIHGHEKWKEVRNMKKEEFVGFVVESLKELREKVGKLEKEITNLKTTNTATDTTPKTESVSVNLSKMHISLTPARKGVALRIRFARFIKPNNRNEVYVILTEDDLKALRNVFNTVKYSTTKSKTNKNGNVEVTTPDNAI